jgi:hypothetical protein
MTHKLILPAMIAAALAMHTAAGAQQIDMTLPGGANGSNVYCLQAGDLTSGLFVGTYLQTGPGAWEERLKGGTFKLSERQRQDLTLELFDSARSAAVQFDFVNRTVKYKASSPNASWSDRYYILNATDKSNSTDCSAFAALTEQTNEANKPGGGTGAGGGGNRGGGGGSGGNFSRIPTNPTIMVVLPPKTPLNIPPGTELTALAGPPCPGHPGFFLCPNKFTCAPNGGVCCPGAGGACGPGLFCDHFVAGNCITAGNPRFCSALPGQPGQATHCDVGLTCVGNNMCQ